MSFRLAASIVSRAALVAILSVSAGACARAAAGGGDAAASAAAESKPSTPPVLAEGTNPSVPLVVQVLEARHASSDTVRVALAFTNKSTDPEPLPLFAGADPADFCLITTDGARRLFLLRDARNQPVLDGSVQPLKPGERRVLQATFPAPPAPAERVTILLGKLVLRNVPISPQ